MSIDNLASRTIEFLRFPLMVGIVFIHFNILNGFIVQGVVYGADIPVLHRFIINLWSDVVTIQPLLDRKNVKGVII